VKLNMSTPHVSPAPDDAPLLIWRVGRSLDKAAVDAFRARLRDPGQPIVADLSEVTRIDSHGLMGIIRLLRSSPTNHRLVLAKLNPYAATIARITHLHEVFDIYATVDSAVAAFGRSVAGLIDCSPSKQAR
jgi:anti-anti-sigma regulatory factor